MRTVSFLMLLGLVISTSNVWKEMRYINSLVAHLFELSPNISEYLHVEILEVYQMVTSVILVTCTVPYGVDQSTNGTLDQWDILTAPCGRLQFSNRINLYPSADLLSTLTKKITVPQEFHINITFIEFKTYFTIDGGCYKERLIFRYGNIEDLRLINDDGQYEGLFCGWRAGWTEYVTSHIVNLQFRTFIKYESFISVLYGVFEKGMVESDRNLYLRNKMSVIYELNLEHQLSLHLVHALKVRADHTKMFHIISNIHHQIKTSITYYGMEDKPQFIVTPYDGPDTHSRILPTNITRDNKEVIIHQSTGFLLTISVTSHLAHIQLDLHYMSVISQIAPLVVRVQAEENGDGAISLPNTRCQVNNSYLNLCLLHISATGGESETGSRGFVIISINQVRHSTSQGQ